MIYTEEPDVICHRWLIYDLNEPMHLCLNHYRSKRCDHEFPFATIDSKPHGTNYKNMARMSILIFTVALEYMAFIPSMIESLLSPWYSQIFL